MGSSLGSGAPASVAATDLDALDAIRKAPIDGVLVELETARVGLASDEAAVRQGRFGKNVIQSEKKKSPVIAFLANFTHLMAVLLWVAGTIAFIAGLPELGVAVWLVNIINGVFSFWQEARASQATEALKKMLPAYATVIRDGQEQKILAEDLVPGDVMLLAEGDKISADARVIASSDLQVNQSTLNGESTPSRKTADAVLEEGLSAAEIPNLVFAGTSVSEGNGRAVVFRIGMDTEFGKIASLTQNMQAAESPLTRQLNRLTKQVTIFAMCMGIAFFCLSLFVVHEPFASSFIFALGMVVAFIPEGLLPTVTLSLAMAVQRMSRRNALVKKLDSVEALGSTSVICTDKTGTLTQNEMTVNHLWTATREYEITGVGYAPEGHIEAEGRSWRAVDDADLELLLEGGMLCGNARLAEPEEEGKRYEVYGDPTEACLIVSAQKGGIDRAELEARMPRVKELPFESRRKRMTTVHALEYPLDGARRIAFTKGAPNEVVRLSTHVRVNGVVEPMTEELRARIMEANDTYAADGLRVLAVAYRPLDGANAEEGIPDAMSDYTPENIECNLTFVGLEVMMDPPRPEVAAAVAECHRAGIRIVMITGDYGLTAASIARRLKIVEGEGLSVISGFELSKMGDEELKEKLAGQVVFARMAPEQKLRVVTALQEMGEIVAVTGDGVNDAPALKKADIGVAMGITGTEVSKDAAAMILADDNFATIVNAVTNGRGVYENIKNVIGFLLSGNMAGIFCVLYASLMALPAPFAAVHLLFINLLTDSLPAIAIGMEPASSDLLNRKPRDPKEPLLSGDLVKRIGLQGLLIAVPVMTAFYLGCRTGTAEAMTMAFATLTLARLFHGFNCREDRSILRMGLSGNPASLAAFGVGVLLLLAVLLIPALHGLFLVADLTLAQLGMILGLAVLPTLCIQITRIARGK